MLLPNRSTKLAEKEKSYGGFAIFFGPGTLKANLGHPSKGWACW
jgi:hypothetical protein